MLHKSIFILSFVFSCAIGYAQEVGQPVVVDQENVMPITVEHEIAQPDMAAALDGDMALQDSLHLPLLNALGQMPTLGYRGYYNYLPLYGGMGWGFWQLHEGLNVGLGASVFAEFGKNARRGAGFSQQLAVQYAQPLTDKLSLAVGGYLTNVIWQHDSYRDAGLSAVLGYRFNEKWEAYVYGQKSLMHTNNYMPMSVYALEQIGDRVGAAVKYNFSPSFSVQLGFEETVTPNIPRMPVPPSPHDNHRR
ncbi:MAG: hypothetical protein MJZ29_00700 [Bacteroidaceae bacterium]|nr:hypothetical protein [Bacteroidaceae bacterium]